MILGCSNGLVFFSAVHRIPSLPTLLYVQALPSLNVYRMRIFSAAQYQRIGQGSKCAWWQTIWRRRILDQFGPLCIHQYVVIHRTEALLNYLSLPLGIVQMVSHYDLPWRYCRGWGVFFDLHRSKLESIRIVTHFDTTFGNMLLSGGILSSQSSLFANIEIRSWDPLICYMGSWRSG